MARVAQLMEEKIDCDFVDINMGCPIDLIYRRVVTSTHKAGPPSLTSVFCRKGMGSGLMARKRPLENIMRSMSTILSKPLTIKMRTGIYSDKVSCDWSVDRSTEL